MREKNCPQCHWVAVVDRSGRRHLEMRWQSLLAERAVHPARAA